MTKSRLFRSAAITVAGILAMAGCGGGNSGEEKAAELTKMAQSVPGVQGADLSFVSGAGNSKSIEGSLTLATSDKSEGVAVLDKVYAAMTPLLGGGDAVYGLRFVTKTATGDLVSATDVGLVSNPSGFDLAQKYGARS